MFRRLGLIAGLLVTFLVLAAPFVVRAEEQAYAEGMYFETHTAGPNHSEVLQVTATKYVDGKWRQTLVHYYYRACFRNQCSTTDATGILYEDPDGLDVSEDLGWGGLEGQITLPDGRIVQFNVAQFASESAYWEDGGYFNRNASLDGFITVDGAIPEGHDFSRPVMPYYYSETAYNFSDQWPGY